MQMPSSGNHAFKEHALDLTWSLWSELGVSGWGRRHQQWGVDPEPLVIFTAWIGELDTRLRDESLDWCLSYGRYLSRSRLRNLLKDIPSDIEAAFGRYATTLNEHSNLNWPGIGEPYEWTPSGKSHVEDFTPPSLIALRFRALFGVSGRAETLRVLLAANAPLAASEIAEMIDYTKRNVSDALDSLRMAGLVSGEPRGNQIRYRLRQKELERLMAPLPKWFPAWKPVLNVVKTILTVDSLAKSPKAARAVEANKTIRSITADLIASGLKGPDTKVTGESYWDALQEWSQDLMTALSAGDAPGAFDAERLPAYKPK